MKKLFLSLLLAVCAGFANATVHTIVVADFSFTPATVNAECGDTIEWVWQDGFHNTTSQTIPACADPWASDMSSTSTTFQYILGNCEGTYSYECTFHPGMAGVINVSCATGVEILNASGQLKIFPNPSSGQFVVSSPEPAYRTSRFAGKELLIYNSLGEIVIQQFINSTTQQFHLKAGVYFLKIEGKADFTQKLVVY